MLQLQQQQQQQVPSGNITQQSQLSPFGLGVTPTAASIGGAAADWFSSIENHFSNTPYDDDMFGSDFIPRSVEEMMLLSYQHLSKQQQNQDEGSNENDNQN